MRQLRCFVLVLGFVVLATLASRSAEAQAPKATETIPVAMYSDAGASGKGPAMLEEKFHKETEFRITRVRASDIRVGKLQGFRVLIVPGGSSKLGGTTLGADGRAVIREFVENGGTYVGICAGCYLASCQYDWSLHILPAKVRDTANWERGRANLTLTLTPDGKDWLGRKEGEVKSVYHNGPVLEPLADAKDKLIPLAMYKDEVTRKGAKEGLMKDTPAIAASRYGKGWVLGVSPHPEQTADLKDLVPAAIRWTLNNQGK